MTDIQALFDAADELTDSRQHVEIISAWVNRNRKTIRRVTTLPSLLDQLQAAVIPGETHIETEGARPGFGSRPPARLDAIDRLLAIQAGAARWVVSVGLAMRPQTAGNIRALVGISGALDSDTFDALCYEVTTWRLWAATVTGWVNPPYRPHVPCPVCDKVGSLRIRLDQRVATCMDCGEAWDERSIGLLGEHIRLSADEPARLVG